tara:strand:- start:224 stop:592 length:369 start_codon:yes stop_codon:yes gene_type:complete
MSQKTIEKNESKQAMVRAKYVGQSPYKLRRIANIVRNKTYHEAMAILNNMPHKASFLISKVLKSAYSNAKNNLKLDDSDFKIAYLAIDEAPFFKRHQPRARGRMFQILKRRSHIIVQLESIS